MTTGEAVAYIRSATSHDADDQVTSAQYIAWLQLETNRIRRRLASAVPTLNSSTQSTTLTAGQTTLSLPSDFLALRRLEKLSGSNYFPVLIGDGLTTNGLNGLEAREQGAQIIISPAREAPGTYLLTYVTTGNRLIVSEKQVRLATTAALPANTAAGAGVGATLTANAVGVLTVDGSAVVLNDRIFVQPAHAGAADRAGIYLCTTEGTAGAAFVLTRATDFDEAKIGEVEEGAAILAVSGVTNFNKTYVLTTTGPITVDTTNLEFATWSSGVSSILPVPIGLEDVVCERVAARVRERCYEDPSRHTTRAEEIWRDLLPSLKKRYGAHPVSGLRRTGR